MSTALRVAMEEPLVWRSRHMLETSAGTPCHVEFMQWMACINERKWAAVGCLPQYTRLMECLREHGW